MKVRPSLFSFDIFGTVLDWRRGLGEALAAHGVTLAGDAFDRIIDAQGALEQGPFRRYEEIVALSLEQTLRLPGAAARAVAATIPAWPLFADSASALERLQRIAPCVATTNSDVAHRAPIEAKLGFALSDWVCAESVGVYKPDARVWSTVEERLGVARDPAWHHVSAYADYDLETARRLGLTCVFVARDHSRPGPSDLRVETLTALADRFA